MTNRTDEYWKLVQELAQPPKELESCVVRARNKARRIRFIKALGRPAAALAGAAACFVLMVNAFPTFALACSGVPVIRELTAAVALSPSLSAAVAHDYVQYIGQSRTVDGVTVNLEYAITDRNQTVFFYSVKGGRIYTSPDLTGIDGEPIGGYASEYGSGENGALDKVTLSFVAEKNTLPSRFTMEMFIMPEPGPLSGQTAQVWKETPAAAPDARVDDGGSDLWEDPRRAPGVVSLSFDVALDPSRIAEPVLAEVGRWMELDGQRIRVERLEFTPTRTVMYLGEDPANTAWLRSLKFWFEDESGTRYENVDGSMSATGGADSNSYLTYYFQSFYYDRPKGLTLCVDKAEGLDKDAPRVVVDLTTGESSGLPQGVRVEETMRGEGSARLTVVSPEERKYFGQTFSHIYWDPEGGRHECNHMSFVTMFDKDGNETPGLRETLYLDGYRWDTVELELSYTKVSTCDEPMCVPLTPGEG